MDFEQLYNSACGIVGVWHIDSKEELDTELDELENDLDFSFFGLYSSTQEIDEELLYQGLSLDDITKMSLNRYGNVIEVLEYNNEYYVYIGAR